MGVKLKFKKGDYIYRANDPTVYYKVLSRTHGQNYYRIIQFHDDGFTKTKNITATRDFIEDLFVLIPQNVLESIKVLYG